MGLGWKSVSDTVLRRVLETSVMREFEDAFSTILKPPGKQGGYCVGVEGT